MRKTLIIAAKFSSCPAAADERISRTSQFSPGGVGGAVPSDKVFRGGGGGAGAGRDTSVRGAGAGEAGDGLVLLAVVFVRRSDGALRGVALVAAGGAVVTGGGAWTGACGGSGAGLMAPCSASSCHARNLGSAGGEAFARS